MSLKGEREERDKTQKITLENIGLKIIFYTLPGQKEDCLTLLIFCQTAFILNNATHLLCFVFCLSLYPLLILAR